MENNPFQNNSESDTSDWEVSNDDLAAERKAEDAKEKPKRNLFESSKDRIKREEAEAGEKKKSLFEALLSKESSEEEPEEDKIEKQPAFFLPASEVDDEPLVEAQPATEEYVVQEFEELVVDKIDALDESIVGESEPVHVGELLADAGLLENIIEKLEEGQDPVKAIENATEEALENPLPDASIADIAVETESPTVQSSGESEPTEPPSRVRQLVYMPPPSPMQLNQMENSYVESDSPTAASEEELVPMNDSFSREPSTGRVVVAGIVGYALGRRGGRKRTEEKLKPVIEEQKRGIDDLSQQLESSETAVIKAARAQAEAEKVKAESQARTLSSTADLEKTIQQQAETLKAERDEFEEREELFEQKLAEEQVNESKDTQVEKDLVEKLQPVEAVSENEILQAEKRRIEKGAEETIEAAPAMSRRVETKEEKRQEKAKVAAQVEQRVKERNRLQQQAEKRVDARTMTLSKVLEVAEYIPLKGSMNLRQMYEAGQIDAVSIRRVVQEYALGRNYEKILTQSLDAVELRSELKHEVKQDNSIYKQPEQAAHSVVAGIISATGLPTDQQVSAAAQQRTNAANVPYDSVQTSEENGLFISNGTAIVLGILAGIVIMILIILYSSFF